MLSEFLFYLLWHCTLHFIHILIFLFPNMGNCCPNWNWLVEQWSNHVFSNVSMGSMLILSVFSDRVTMWEHRSALKDLRPRLSGIPCPFSTWSWPLYTFKKVALTASTSLLFWCSFLLNSLPYSFRSMILYNQVLAPLPKPTDCTKGLNDHSIWIKETESSFHSLSTPSQ